MLPKPSVDVLRDAGCATGANVSQTGCLKFDTGKCI